MAGNEEAWVSGELLSGTKRMYTNCLACVSVKEGGNK